MAARINAYFFIKLSSIVYQGSYSLSWVKFSPDEEGMIVLSGSDPVRMVPRVRTVNSSDTGAMYSHFIL